LAQHDSDSDTEKDVEEGAGAHVEPKVVEPKVGIEPTTYALPRRCPKPGRFRIRTRRTAALGQRL
jgi:hypothetical protein